MNKDKMIRKVILRLVFAVILLVLVGLALRPEKFNSQEYSVRVVPPTCVENGYSLYTHKREGNTITRDIVPPLGHQFSNGTTIRNAEGVEPEIRCYSCTRCGLEEKRAVYAPSG